MCIRDSQNPSTEGSSRAASRRAPCYGRGCFGTATCRAARRRRKLPCRSALIRSTAPTGRRP
eukprot:11131154-Alexandrium_andersonii.AAC.1